MATPSAPAIVQLGRNGKVEIDAPTDEQAKQCARILNMNNKEHGSAIAKSLDLRRGTITSVGAGSLAKALRGNSNLRHLGLQGNCIGDEGVRSLGIAMEGNDVCALAYLDLSSTGITVVGLKDLVQGAAKLPGLHTLCLSDNNLEQEAGHQLSKLFKTSVSLHTLVAAGNYLGDRGIAPLCSALCHIQPTRVVSLDISSNGVGDLGMQWLTNGISALCRQKETLALQDSSSSPVGGIRHLRLRGNNITHAGAQDLAKLLSEDRCARELRELDLSLNTITNDGFKPLAASLKGCRELVCLDVAGCRLGPGGVRAAAKLLSEAPPRLSKVSLIPKAEFADRVLSDRDGLAVALRQSLQHVADALPFAGTVVDLSLGFYLRADSAAAAAIERTLQEHRERMGVASCTGTGAGTGTEGSEYKVGRSETVDDGCGPPATERPRGAPKSATGSGSSNRTRGNTTESGVSSSAAGRRGDPPPQRSTPGRTRDRQGRARAPSTERPAEGIERPKAGLERTKATTGERARRNAGGHASGVPTAGTSATPPAGSSSLLRTPSKASMRRTPSAGRSSQKTTAATLAARDRDAAAALSSATAHSIAPPHRRRMHQGEELDSIDGFTPLPTAVASTRRTPPSSTAASRRPAASGGGGTGSLRTPAHSGGRNVVSPSIDGVGAASTSGGGSSARTPLRKVSARGITVVADVVSEVMRDTTAMDAYPDSPPPVAPSTWQDSNEDVNSSTPQVHHTTDSFFTPSSTIGESPPSSAASTRPPPHISGGGSGDVSSKQKLLRKTSSSSSVKDIEEPELAEEMTSLALTTDEGGSRARSNKETGSVSSHETALEPSTASGAGAQQMISIAQAGQLLAPIVASQVALETKRIELKFQNDLNTAVGKIRLEMHSIDREGLVARVALEKRVSSSVKRLMEKIEQMERRFARMEREERERKRLALEASGEGAATAPNALVVAGVTPPRLRRAAAITAPPPPPGARGAGSPAPADEWWDGEAAVEAGGVVGGEGSAARRKRGGGMGVVPESARPAAMCGEEAGGGGSGEPDSGVATSEEEFMDSCDEAEADLVRRLEEKMMALEGKLRGHEERQRTEYIGVDDDSFGQRSAVYA